jgi:hypothetical protein
MPSVVPTTTPFPTPDPETTECGLKATIDCNVIDGPTINCQTLVEPSVNFCLTGDGVPLTELRFQYTGRNCADGSVGCDTTNRGPSGAAEVFVEILEVGGDPYVEVIVPLDGFVVVQNPTGFTLGVGIEIVVWLVEIDSAGMKVKGLQVQDLVINTDCDDGSLVLGRDFGTLLLAAFKNEVDGLQTLFASYRIDNLIQNISPFGATITEAVVASTISGPRYVIIGDDFGVVPSLQ